MNALLTGQLQMHTSTSQTQPPPPPPPTPVQSVISATSAGTSSNSTLTKPKPILVDKQSSEPNTPITRNFDRPIQRGNSDLGQRLVKKRVTLRHSLDTCAAQAVRCSSAGTARPITEAQRTVRSDSSLGCIMLASATSAAPAIQLEPDADTRQQQHKFSSNQDSQSTQFSSADSFEPEPPSEASTAGTEVESLVTSDEIEAVLGSAADFDYIDDIPGPLPSQSSSRKGSQESSHHYHQHYQPPYSPPRLYEPGPSDRLLAPPELEPGNDESDCDLSSSTTIVQASETESLLKPSSSDNRLHPQYRHHPHHQHHHSHHHSSSSSNSRSTSTEKL